MWACCFNGGPLPLATSKASLRSSPQAGYHFSCRILATKVPRHMLRSYNWLIKSQIQCLFDSYFCQATMSQILFVSFPLRVLNMIRSIHIVPRQKANAISCQMGSQVPASQWQMFDATHLKSPQQCSLHSSRTGILLRRGTVSVMS